VFEGDQDGIWQPGDGWVDTNLNNQVDIPINGLGDSWQETSPDGGYNNIWPLSNGIWDEGEMVVRDCGQDGLCPGDAGYLSPDAGENDGLLIAWDLFEKDGVFDTGDGLYGFEGEPIINDNGNGRLDPGEEYLDTHADGQYNAPDLPDNYQVVLDTNGDGLNDYPDFEIDNRKVEIRIDYDPDPDFNMTLQSAIYRPVPVTCCVFVQEYPDWSVILKSGSGS
jgi:hypothetical protein